MNTDLNPQAAPERVSQAERGKQANDILAQAFGMGESPAIPEATPPPADTGVENATDVAGEPASEQEAAVVDTGTEPAPEGETPETQAAGTEQDQEVRTFKELAEVLEVEPEFLYNLEFKLGGSGESRTLGSIKDQLQDQETLTRARTQLETQRNEFQQQQQAWQQQVAQSRQQVLQAPQEVMQAQAEIVAWTKAGEHLEANKDQFDPGTLALKKQEVMTGIQSAQARLQDVTGRLRGESDQMFRQKMVEEAQQLRAKVPEWTDPSKAQQGRAEITGMMQEYGFTPDALNTIGDHRYIVMLRDLARLKSELANAKKVITRGAKIPRVLKPGAAPDVGTAQKQKLNAQLDAAKQSRNLRTKAAAVAQLLATG